MALTEIEYKICRFHGSLSRKGSRPLLYAIHDMIYGIYDQCRITPTLPPPKCLQGPFNGDL